jgi:hypothetical protein
MLIQRNPGYVSVCWFSDVRKSSDLSNLVLICRLFSSLSSKSAWYFSTDLAYQFFFPSFSISSGSLNHFIKTSKHTKTAGNGTAHMPEKSWKRWSRQILTALKYEFLYHLRPISFSFWSLNIKSMVF